MHFCFNNQFIKVKRTFDKIAKIPKKNILFCFSIRDYEFIRKCIPDIKKIFLLTT
jgi:hypothetical protein